MSEATPNRAPRSRRWTEAGMSLTHLIQRRLGKRGYQLQRTPVEGSLDRDLQRVISERQISTVLDIGAHVGIYATQLRAHGFGGKIISFEPSPGPFAELKARAAGDWQVHQLALGDCEGDAALHVYAEHEEFSSLRSPSTYGRKNFGLTLVETVSVRVRRLDDVSREIDVDPERSLVKIDTQGHDVAVMAGGTTFLARAAALQVEIPMFGLYEDAPLGTTMIEQIQGLGFDLVGLFPVHEHPRPLVPVEFDGLFIRRDVAD